MNFSDTGLPVSKLNLGHANGLELSGLSADDSLSRVLRDRGEVRFASIASMPSNANAMGEALLFSQGRRAFVAIEGPTGLGKTQILRATAESRRRNGDQNTRLVAAEQFLAHKERVDASVPLILDDCQEIARKPRLRLQLRLALEHRLRCGAPTLLSFTSSHDGRGVESTLPRPTSWQIERIVPPGVQDRTMLVKHFCELESLTVSEDLVSIIARNLIGNGRVYMGAVRRLGLIQRNWVSPSHSLRACGLLDPFFVDNSAWDLRHRIYREAQSMSGLDPEFPVFDASCYTMLRTAQLCERSISNYLECAPCEVYAAANRHAKVLKTDAHANHVHLLLVERVLTRLCRQPGTNAD